MSEVVWLILIINLPGKAGTARMRVWRALKSAGAGILRDGVYVLPESEQTRSLLELQAGNIEAAGGAGYLLSYSQNESDPEFAFHKLFDRSAEYYAWLVKVSELHTNLGSLDEPETRRKESQLRREFEAVAAMDYFPGEGKARATNALEELLASVNQRFSPDEPTSQSGDVERRSINEFSGRRWATRRSLWVDRMASAWLIRRFIDPDASFIWLEHARDCPTDAVGFDFDGATFSHIENLVTFEVLVRAFELDTDMALAKLGTLIHYVDVGGLPVADAAGLVTMLTAAKQQCGDDDSLLNVASTMLDLLYTAYAEAGNERPPN